TFTPSDTPSITPSPTETPVTPTSEVGVAETNTPGPSETPGGPTDTPLAVTATPLPGINDLANTKAAMDKTNAAATCVADPNACKGGAATATGFGVSPTGGTKIGVVSSKTPKAIPSFGFFEDLGGGKASPDSLAFIGLAAVVLVGVIFASRKLRIK